MILKLIFNQGLDKPVNDGDTIVVNSLNILNKMAIDKVENLKQEIKEKITQKSLSLEKYGLNDLAWNKENAKDLIQSIMKDHIGIRGGGCL